MSFDSIFAAARGYARTVGKRLVIQEMGSVGSTACGLPTGHTRGAWIRAAGETIKSWPEILAVVYTEAVVQYKGQTLSFRVESTPASLQVYTDVGHDPYFN